MARKWRMWLRLIIDFSIPTFTIFQIFQSLPALTCPDAAQDCAHGVRITVKATPSFDFALDENARMIRDSVERFADEQIAPRAAAIDALDQFPRDLWPMMGAIGLHGITVATEDGGLGLGYLDHVIAVEEVSRASASIGLSYGAHSNLCINQIARWGTVEQKTRYLPKLIEGTHVGALAMSEVSAGSDVISMRLRADKVAGDTG
jgi:isovaleryl-CoA dehydrogenase